MVNVLDLIKLLRDKMVKYTIFYNLVMASSLLAIS
jgi:hypothetical protein